MTPGLEPLLRLVDARILPHRMYRHQLVKYERMLIGLAESYGVNPETVIDYLRSKALVVEYSLRE